MLGWGQQAGDTIIEVLIAITVFSSLAVGAIAIMNQGTATAQRALEITLVRQQIDGQVETIRYMHQKYSGAIAAGASSSDPRLEQWNEMMAKVKPTVSSFDLKADGSCEGSLPPSAFVVDPQTASVATGDPKSATEPTSTPYAQVVDTSATIPAYGIWVEAVKKDPSSAQKFIDFHVRTCWNGPGGGPALTLGTIVRLYVPQ